MKKIFSWMGVLAAAAMTLAGCAEELGQPKVEAESGVPYELVAKVATKTVNDGLATDWDDDDALNVFYAETGSEDYGTNCPFTVADAEEGLFKGTLHTELDAAKAYDWYVLYSDGKAEYIKSPASTDSNGGYTYLGDSRGLLQSEYGSKAHLVGSSCPLYGVVKELGAAAPLSLDMKQLASVIELKVTNATDAPLTVKTAIIKVPGTDLVGSFYFDLTTSPVTYTPVSGKTYDYATVTVENPAELAVGESAALYFVVNPLTLEAGDKWSIQINETEAVEKELASALTFKAGEIFTVNYSAAALAEPEEPETTAKSLPWEEDFSSGSLDGYIVDEGGKTKLYEDKSYSGGAVPELLIATNGGSFSVNIATDGYVGNLSLTYLTNNDSRIKVSSETPGVTVSKDADMEYVVSVSEGVETFVLTFENINTGSNVRIDNIRLAAGARESQTLTFAESSYSFEIGSDEANAFEAPTVEGAKTQVTYTSSNENIALVDPETGYVVLGETAGTATITATAAETDAYKSATATYTITLYSDAGGDTAKGESYTLTFSSEEKFDSNGSKDFGGLTWTLDGDGGYWGWNDTKGNQLGSQAKPYTSMTILTSSYSGGVETVKVNTSGASSTKAKLTVMVNGTQYGDVVSLTTTATEYTFSKPENKDMQAGEIVLKYTQESSKAIYINSIKIN